MTLKLAEIGDPRYSHYEYRLFNSIPQDGSKIGTRELAEARRRLGNWDVNEPLKNISVMMNKLIAKIDDNNEPFQIVKDLRRPGHNEVKYQLIVRSQKKVGRPKTTGTGVPIVVRMQPSEIIRLDRWIGDAKISRPEALRQLMEWALDAADDAAAVADSQNQPGRFWSNKPVQPSTDEVSEFWHSQEI
jgi:hypothetical protein